MLFNIVEDPGEQINQIDNPECQAIMQRLDGELTSMLLKSISSSHSEKQVGASWEDLEFGRGGWERTYPRPIGG